MLVHSNQAQQSAWRRKAYTLRKMGRLDKSVEELSALLDTFYNEVDGWVELAEIYYLCNQYSLHPPYPLKSSHRFQTQLCTASSLTRAAFGTPKPILCARIRRNCPREWRCSARDQNVSHGGRHDRRRGRPHHLPSDGHYPSCMVWRKIGV